MLVTQGTTSSGVIFTLLPIGLLTVQWLVPRSPFFSYALFTAYSGIGDFLMNF